MAASGYTPISLYYSTTASAVPSSGNLVDGELAINTADEKLYFKNSSGTVKLLSSSAGAEGTVTSVGGTGTVNGLTLTGTVTTSGNLTLGGTLANVDLTTAVTGTLPIANGGTGTTSTTFVNLTTNVTGTLPVANGGTGVTSSTGTGSVVLSASPTFTGTVSAAGLNISSFIDLADNDILRFGSSDDMEIYHNGTANYMDLNVGDLIVRDNTTTRFTFGRTTGNLTITGAFSGGGVSTIPQDAQNANYTLVAGDAGQHIYKSNTSAYTWTIPANASVAFAVGTVVTFVNGGSAGNITIAITSDTMRLAGAGTTGSRTLAAYGVATAIKVASTTWIISGVGLT